MKVIVATTRSQGARAGDYAWTLDGELVHLPALACATPDVCGCGRGFAGVSSHRATSTAEVTDRELGRDDVVSAVARSLADGGWFPVADADDAVLAAQTSSNRSSSSRIGFLSERSYVVTGTSCTRMCHRDARRTTRGQEHRRYALVAIRYTLPCGHR